MDPDESQFREVSNDVDFKNHVVFYEDSEGDFNVLSEDEDLVGAQAYVQDRNWDSLKCSIVNKRFFEDVLRKEQVQSDLNQSITWNISGLNNFGKRSGAA